MKVGIKGVLSVLLLTSIICISGVYGAIFDREGDFCKPKLLSHSFPDAPSAGSSVNAYMQYIIDIFDWLNKTNLLFCAIIPVLGAFFVTLGFLETLRIFKTGWINVAIAILVGLSFTSFGPLNFLVGYIFQGLGTWGIAVFALMFGVGTYLLFLKRQAEWGSQASVAGAFREEAKNLRTDLKEKREEYKNLVSRLSTANIVARPGIRRRMEQVDEEIRDTVERLKELDEAAET